MYHKVSFVIKKEDLVDSILFLSSVWVDSWSNLKKVGSSLNPNATSYDGRRQVMIDIRQLEISPLKPGQINIVVPAGFAVIPPEGIDPHKAERIRKWRWVDFNQLWFAIPSVAILQGRENAGFSALPRDVFERFGLLMEGGYNYLIYSTLTNIVPAEGCFIGASSGPEKDEYSLLVPAGWSKLVLWLATEGVIRVNKGHLQPNAENFVAYRGDGSWYLMGRGNVGGKKLTRHGPDGWNLSFLVPASQSVVVR